MSGNFRNDVCELVAQIPEGRVMSYGDIAALVGHPYAARQVGGVAHFGPSNLPWHRVVNRKGGLASGYYGGREGQKAMLEAEGVLVNDTFIIDDFAIRRWRPS